MGRSPCCDKVGLKKGPWTPEEDQKLLAYIEEHGHGSWRALPTKAGLQRCGKSCRLRWTNYLRPDIKRGKFSLQEEQTIIQLHALLGNRWSAIATHVPERTDNEIKNYWNTHLKKRLAKMGIDPVTHKPKSDTLLSNEGQPKSAANLSHMAQWESARLEAEARLVRQSKLRSTTTTFHNPSNSSLLNQPIAPPEPPRCLYVLKALNGFWGKPNCEDGPSCIVGGGGGGGDAGVSVMGINGDQGRTQNYISVGTDLESSTSTLSYSENGPKGSNHLPEYNSMSPFTSGVINDMPMSTIENSWTEESIRAKAEHIPSGNFVETFTDLLLSGSGGDRSFSEDDGDTDNGGSRAGNNGTNCSDYSEDDKNYWNSILHLVNSSPSDNSPNF